MMRHLALAIALACAGSALSPPLAYAALDPAAAEADTQGGVRSDDYTFCSDPEDPLSGRARAMCPLAGDVPGCTALVALCDKEPDPAWEPGEFWKSVARFIGNVAPYFAWGAILALALLVITLVVRAIRDSRDEILPTGTNVTTDVTVLADAPLAAETTAAEILLRRAAEAYASGDARTALLTYLAAALRALDDRSAIRLARDRTNGEYVRSCQEPASRSTLRDLVRDVDSVQFGGAPATAEMIARAENRAANIVRAPREGPSRFGAVAMMSLALVVLLGACKGLGLGSRSDPAGRDLLAALLTKQGAVLSSLPGSLANLPMKGASGPVIVLDAEQVPLEDETRDHLVAWVKQGGTLVLAGDPSRWPSEFWAKRLSSWDAAEGPTTVRVETRPVVPTSDDDEDEDPPPASTATPEVHHAKLAHRAAMTWPNEDRAPRAIAQTEEGELYGALRAFGKGRVLGLASNDLLTNLGLAVPGNAAALVAMLATLDENEFAIARFEQGISPPSNPLAGMLHIGLGPALVHAAVFIPLLFFAYGVRQSAPRPALPARRRAFAEHVQAVGGLYARRRAAAHALSVYAKHVDDRVRARMTRGTDPATFLAARSGADVVETTQLYARAMSGETNGQRGEELRLLQRLSSLYLKAMDRG